MKSSALRAEASQSGLPKTRAARAMPPIISAFHDVRIFSSRPGRTRFSRAAKSLSRARVEQRFAPRLVMPSAAATSSSGRATTRCQRLVLEVGRPVEAVVRRDDRVLLGA